MQLQAQCNNISVCATNGDSVALPKIVPYQSGDGRPGMLGMVVFVRNSGAADLQVFGGTNAKDTINGVATATGVTVGTLKSAIFWAQSYTVATDVGNWCMVLSA